METGSWCKRLTNLNGPANQAFSHRTVWCRQWKVAKIRGFFQHGADVALMQGAHEQEAKEMGS